VALTVAILSAAWIASDAGEPPPSRTPREKLMLGDKDVFEGRRILLDEDSYPREPAILVEGPEIKRDNGKLTITFALNKNDDVLVRVVDAEGNIVRNLACGVLGENAPKLFQKGSVKQKIVWDGKDDQGKPVLAGCKVCVAVGLRPRFERFVADDPTQLLNHICGMEVDQQGRVYVTQFTERRGEPEVRRYNRDGEYLETVYPPNPNHLRGELAEVFSHVDDVDGRAIPRRRGAWPFFIYKYHSPYEYDPTRYPFPLRVTSDGRAYIAEIASAHSDLTPAELAALEPVKCRIFPVDLDPFWFLKRMDVGVGAWAIDDKGYAYLCCTNRAAIGELRRISALKDDKFIGNTVLKLSLESLKPAADFQYNGREKLSDKRPYLGTWRIAGDGPEFFQNVHDLTVDRNGNIYVVDGTRTKIYRPNGQFIKVLDKFTLDGKEMELGAVHGVRAAGRALYVVARLDQMKSEGRLRIKRWRTAQLVKFQLAPAAEPEAVWTMPLDGLANLVAVDQAVDPPIVWVGNGGGPATFTRIVDEGKKPAQVRHIGRTGKRALMDPWAVAVDGQGRVFTFDYARRRIVRTNDDGSDWLESEPVDRLVALKVDRLRGRLYQSSFQRTICTDLDFNNITDVKLPPGRRNLGAVDAAGNLFVSRSGKTSLGQPGSRIVDRFGPDGLNGLIDRYGPDGKLQEAGMIELFQGMGGLARDSKGSIYVMDTCREQFQYVAHDVGRRLLGSWPLWKRGHRTILNQSELGYLVKFAPGGGKRGTQAELWAHRGASPIMSQCRCPVATNCVAVDEADRVFATDYLKYHVKVLDTAGNLITRIGSWGNADCRGPNSRYADPEIPFGWLHSIDANSDTLYVSDKDMRRIVKVRLDYREVKKVAVP